MTDDRNVIAWDRPMLERFKKALAGAKLAEFKTFVFDGNDFAVSYAQYLVEYLEGRLP